MGGERERGVVINCEGGGEWAPLGGKGVAEFKLPKVNQSLRLYTDRSIFYGTNIKCPDSDRTVRVKTPNVRYSRE